MAQTSRIGLRARLLLTSTLVLGLGLGLTGWVLDRSFTASVVAGAEEQLKLLIYSLLGAAEEEGTTLRFPSSPLEPRLEQPESGLYATVSDVEGNMIWRSPSLQYGNLAWLRLAPAPTDRKLVPGSFLFRETDGRFEMFYRVIWETEGDQIFTFRVIADQAPFRLAIASFRRTLMFGLAAVVIALMGAQVLAIAWGLRPVATMASRIEAIEAGRRERMGEDYPPELSGLARNIDRFIDHEISSRDRYRTAMDDLAHSLKTPLAVFRNALTSGQAEDQKLLRDQLDRMETTVAHQLSRAMAARPVVLAGWTAPAPLAERLIKALRTAYISKNVAAEHHIPGGTGIALRRARLDGNVGQPARKRIQVLPIESDDRRRRRRDRTLDDRRRRPRRSGTPTRTSTRPRRARRHDGSRPRHRSRRRRRTRGELPRRADDRRVTAWRRACDPRTTGSV